MKTALISDTHSYHRMINLPTDIECIVHCGDSTNYKELYRNEIEFEDSLDWYSNLDVKYKILIAGNHCTWATKKYNIDKVKEAGIIYLNHEYYEINGIKFFGSPYTPIFGDWNFMVDRSKLSRYWEVLEEGIDLLITHGPPKGILDIAQKRDGNIEFCGDSALWKAVNKVKPKYHAFGHIHDNHNIVNNGIRIVNDITFINCSMVEDGKFTQGIINKPIIIEL